MRNMTYNFSSGAASVGVNFTSIYPRPLVRPTNSVNAAGPATADNATRVNYGMNESELLNAAPSIFATGPDYEICSDYYVFFSTPVVLAALREKGFAPIRAWEDESGWNSQSAHGTHKHAVVLTRPEKVAGKATACVTMINSHNCACYFRFYASHVNGLTGDTFITSKHGRVRHMGHDINEVLNVVDCMASRASEINEIAERMAGIMLTREEQIEFARAAADIRFEGKYAVLNPAALLTPCAGDTEAADLWSVYSVVHHNLLHGGVRVGKRALKKIYTVDNWERINVELWELVERTLDAHGSYGYGVESGLEKIELHLD